MKSNIVFLLFCFSFSFFSFSQNTNDDRMKWTKGWTNFNPNLKEYPEPEEKLPNIIDTDTYLSNDITYFMSGNVYVVNNTKLTIQEGTIIRCDTENATSLVITKGARLIAKGNRDFPIVFTSSKSTKSRNSGDWGGIVIAGSGKINSPAVSKVIEGNFLPEYSLYGGIEEDEMTTEISYVRIEFAGKKINQSKGLNALSLYALGKNSIVNNIMISHSAEDSFECFGGSFDMQSLISFKAKDDDYDFTLGYQGELNNIMAIRHPYITDVSGSYAVEIDGYNKGEGFVSTESLSNVSIKNALLINLSTQNNYQHTTAAISSKNLAKLSVTESRISGFANVVKFDVSYKSFSDLENHFLLENSIFNVHSTTVLKQYRSEVSADRLLKYNMYTNGFQNAEDLFTDPLNSKNPKFTLKDSDSYTVMQ